MTQQNKLWHILLSFALWKRALQGAGIALVLLIIFLSIVGAIDDGTWVFLLMLTVPLGGAGGGAFYHLVNQLWHQDSLWKKLAACFVYLVVYCIGLWLSLVFALDIVGLWH